MHNRGPGRGEVKRRARELLLSENVHLQRLGRRNSHVWGREETADIVAMVNRENMHAEPTIYVLQISFFTSCRLTLPRILGGRTKR